MSRKHDQLIRAYIEAHGFAAITVAPDATVDIHAGSIDWLTTYAATWWLPDLDRAAALAKAALGATDADEATRRIEVAADRCGARLTAHAVMMQRAASAVQLIEDRLRAMKARGDMRALHAEYKDLRARMRETGRNAQPFYNWLHAKKIEMVRSVAARKPGGK